MAPWQRSSTWAIEQRKLRWTCRLLCRPVSAAFLEYTTVVDFVLVCSDRVGEPCTHHVQWHELPQEWPMKSAGLLHMLRLHAQEHAAHRKFQRGSRSTTLLLLPILNSMDVSMLLHCPICSRLAFIGTTIMVSGHWEQTVLSVMDTTAVRLCMPSTSTATTVIYLHRQ